MLVFSELADKGEKFTGKVRQVAGPVRGFLGELTPGKAASHRPFIITPLGWTSRGLKRTPCKTLEVSSLYFTVLLAVYLIARVLSHLEHIVEVVCVVR